MTSPARGGPDTAGMREAVDPRFRDQLAEAAYMPLRRAFCERGIAALDIAALDSDVSYVAGCLSDALMPAIAAEVEARVQVAANQRAAEVRRALAWAWLGHEPHTRDWDGPRSDEALEWADGMLAHPALADALAAAAQPADGRTGE